jgi:anti-sigma factor RsiW
VIRHRRSHDSAMARCREVTKVLQTYLDGQTDDITTQRVAHHLEACRRCGLEARTYREIKAALARRVPVVDELALERLRAFANNLTEAPPAADTEHP